MLGWYRCYVELLRRLRSGCTPSALVTFCGQGGTCEGVRRAGGASVGQDLAQQPRFERRFGGDRFAQGDSTQVGPMVDLKRRARAFVTLASPPCQAYSSARFRGEASSGMLIEQTRSSLVAAGGKYAIENVVGARSHFDGSTALLRGAYFGLHVDRPRLFEANFRLHVDSALKVGGDRLRRGTCLGGRRRWRRLDSFGRPVLHECCSGNLWAVQGDKPLRCTTCECASAMGLDDDHMDYAGMAQAIPPAYGQLVFAQACMREVESEFGLPAITHDQMMEDPQVARARMSHWLRGAGGDAPDQGLEFEEPRLPRDHIARRARATGRHHHHLELPPHPAAHRLAVERAAAERGVGRPWSARRVARPRQTGGVARGHCVQGRGV